MIYYCTDKKSVLRRHKKGHKVKESAADENYVEFLSRDLVLLFANKKSGLLPTLNYPIALLLHQFIKTPESFESDICAANLKLIQHHPDLQVSVSDPDPPLNSDADSFVYLKFDKAYLSKLQSEGAELCFSRMLIALLAGDLGETMNQVRREGGHRSSRKFVVTVFFEFSNLPFINKTVEKVLLSCLNTDNFANDISGGESYFIDCLSPQEHVLIVLGLLRDCHQRLKSFFELTEIQLWTDSFDFEPNDVVHSQESTVSIDASSIRLTAISDLTVDRAQELGQVNVIGRCLDKSSFHTRYGDARLTFLLVASDGESVQVISRSAEVFRKVLEGESYYLKSVPIEVYYSARTPKIRILLDDPEKIVHCSSSNQLPTTQQPPTAQLPTAQQPTAQLSERDQEPGEDQPFKRDPEPDDVREVMRSLGYTRSQAIEALKDHHNDPTEVIYGNQSDLITCTKCEHSFSIAEMNLDPEFRNKYWMCLECETGNDSSDSEPEQLPEMMRTNGGNVAIAAA